MEKNSNLHNTVLLSFGNHLRAIRIEKGLTQEELAGRAGFTRSYYTEIETGKRNIALINLYKLADALEVSLSELMDF
ncbi:helix-turn-helix transcriptional regulator [Staphylococcus epidermidis]|uniref:helix-turn-helix domain-containing protein n=1 Tax=Staphylococcus epidermidis TaxID=1282 RepID=UPI0011AAACCB|nr:helix-turn-helix transcriptional regulator [Staphylococcus epidermidis]MBM0790091.1 XRE family transcriptional regulator [Staphylococcus epidermidis]MCG1100914.1 helix-turn-helix transcriptional regulator [Staphylococcus epidermidis]MCG2042047.1 helix-turn-helix transcriptional regulator [Staphylococcus epidermidis]MCG2080177.1 helix-turn-helix transcriptional regulator [Staphylococcus epidermidis]MCG2272403.1 helix-turn-helix transcriptional regulator [Staphylococcus epidermidis]